MTQQQQPRIGIVIGSTREGRFGEKPAHWIYEIAKQRTDLAFELIDLRDHPLPFFNEPRSPAYGPVNNEAARLWAGKLATLDGLIVVTPEYNHGPSAVLKNAFDYAYKEFNRKPIGFVGYGGVGAARAVARLNIRYNNCRNPASVPARRPPGCQTARWSNESSPRSSRPMSSATAI